MPLITIASVTIPNWQPGTAQPVLRINVDQAFTAETGTIYPATQRTHSPASLGTFYMAYPCTVSSNELTIPAVTLDSTQDSPDNPNATYSAELWDAVSGQFIQSIGTTRSFSVAPSPTSTTWAALFAAEALS